MVSSEMYWTPLKKSIRKILINSPHLFYALDEPGPEGKDHLHTRYGLWHDRPPWGHPTERNSYIWRGAPQDGMMHETKFRGLIFNEAAIATARFRVENTPGRGLPPSEFFDFYRLL